MKNIELLAPAGTMDKLIAAVNAGADAIYIGGQKFGARRSAGNFDDNQLIEAVNFCHERNVNVYVTLNTLIKNNEIEDVLNYVAFLYEAQVDALILQDIGLLSVVKKRFPDFECHASTQMALHNLNDVLMAEKLGLSRVVLARELSIDEIEYIREHSSIELEVFVHGALCICYSGLCQMSSVIGGRSGNRGACAQPCRKKYTLVEVNSDESIKSKSGDYILSPKDLIGANQLKRLTGLNNISLKIEGRMKGADYVYTVVSSYRKVLESDMVKSVETDLKRVFNRDFTEGFLGKASYSDLMNYQQPSSYGTYLGKVISYEKGTIEIKLEDYISKGDEIQIRNRSESVGARADQIFIQSNKVDYAESGNSVKIPFKHAVKQGAIVFKTYDKAFIDAAEISATKSLQNSPLQLFAVIKLNEKAILEAKLSDNEIFKIESNVLAEKANKVPLSEERVIEQLSKFGGTQFYVEKIEVILNEGLAFPISEINNMRRLLIEEINRKRRLKYPSRKLECYTDVPKLEIKKDNTLKMHAFFSSMDAIQFAHDNSEILEQLSVKVCFKDIQLYSQNMQFMIARKVIPVLPIIIKNNEINFVEEFLKKYHDETSGKGSLFITHPGQLYYVEKFGFKEWFVDTSANVLNQMTSAFYYSRGASAVYASTEVSVQEQQLWDHPIGIQLYGRLRMMISEYCPVGGVLHGKDQCGECAQRSFGLLDEKNEVLPLVCYPKGCRAEIYSSKILNRLKYLNTTPQEYVKLDFSTLDVNEITKILNTLKNSKSMSPEIASKYFQGNLVKGIE